VHSVVGPRRIVAGVAALVVSAGLVFGLAPAAGAATNGSGAAKADAVTATCTQLRRRLAGAPATLRRVDVNLADLRAALAEVRIPVRRTILQQRIERLEQLRAELQAKIAEARAACATTGNTTT
jgi:multidrug resistance efflux pump